MKRLITTAVLVISISSSAFAHKVPAMPMKDMKRGDMAMMMPSSNDSTSTTGYKSAMMTMMHMAPKFSGDPDVDFMKQMRPHHQAAIDMAKVVLSNGKDEETKKLAQEIITAQEEEIATINAWLKNKGQ